jgi:hypothetical protein
MTDDIQVNRTGRFKDDMVEYEVIFPDETVMANWQSTTNEDDEKLFVLLGAQELWIDKLERRRIAHERAAQSPTKSIYGYFDDNFRSPTYDPGMDVDCPLCGKKLTDDCRSPSFMVPEDGRSYFYRTHRECKNLPDFEALTSEIEGAIVDAVYKAMDSN